MSLRPGHIKLPKPPGAEAAEAARAMVLASLPKDLPPAELKRQLFQRIYGYPLPF
jgi:hypothetical protein